MRHTIKARHSLQLRQVGNLYLMVEVSEENINLTNVYSLNETAAMLWQRINEGAYTAGELATWICGKYRVDRDTALKDILRQLAEWKEFGLTE